jgi:LysR family cyn operon transcriptional activator
MELRHLRYFVALAECLSFTRAAERAHVTQSTLSHQIRQLEDELGHPLFDRIGKRVMLTEAGETFLGYASKALREVDHGLSDLKRVGGELSGEVRIGATGTFNIGFVPEALAMFLKRHPTVKVSVEELAADAIAHRLTDESLDVGIAYQPSDAARRVCGSSRSIPKKWCWWFLPRTRLRGASACASWNCTARAW